MVPAERPHLVQVRLERIVKRSRASEHYFRAHGAMGQQRKKRERPSSVTASPARLMPRDGPCSMATWASADASRMRRQDRSHAA